MSNEAAVAGILARIDRDRDFVIGLTRDMVRIPTVNPKFVVDPEINREDEHQTMLAGVLREIGLETEKYDVFPGRPNVTGTLAGSDERSLILNGHVDVVPLGQRSLWTVDPFGAAITNGRLYGRGAIDMKSGVAACIAATKAIRDEGLTLEGRLEIHAVVDEEAGGFGSIDLVKRGRLAKAAIIAEPTWGVVMPAEGGLEWVRVTIRGKNAHAGWRYNSIYPQRHEPGRIEPGVNAIELGMRFIQAMRELEREWGMRKYHPLMPPGLTTINPGAAIGGTGFGPDGRPELLTNPAIIPDAFIVDLDLKFMPNETKESVRAEFESFVHHFAQTDRWMSANPPVVTWELGGLHFPPLDTPVDHPLVQSVVAARKRLGHADTKITGFVAVCDAAHYAGAGVPGVIYGASGDGFHGTDEYVDVESMIETTKVIAASIVDMCGLR
jgi:acetylornithine deacetylase/succinyl-diaminopimelate desuccinylase family protein